MRNKSGYSDPTAGKAIANIMREKYNPDRRRQKDNKYFETYDEYMKRKLEKK